MDKEIQEVGKFYNIAVDFFANYAFQIIGAIIILFLGVFASKYAHRYTLKTLIKYHMDETLGAFIANLIRFLVIAIMGVLALGKLGISIAPFIAALGAVSLTAGLALQGSVSNFAAGVVLIATKPFKIGDTITVHGIYGEVKEIKLAYTVMINEDKEQITIPNKYMIGDILVNSYAYRIVEGSVGIAYNSDVQRAIGVIREILLNHDKVSNDNEPNVGIAKFSESSIDIGYRYWVPTNSFFKTQYEINLKVLYALEGADVTIPFPQREIRIIGAEA